MKETLLDKKYEYWKNQLLDLGKRNKMINYRESKRTTLKLIEPEFEELFRKIVIEEEQLTFQSPVDKNSDIRTYSILALMESLSFPIPVNIGDIKSEGSILERQKTLRHMRSKSRLALDEQGINILYMIAGFVEWKAKNDTSSSWIKSPLILVPVSLIRNSLNAPYVLKKYDDDVVVNPTLSYLFERDYGITLPSFDSDEQTITEFMDEMENLVDKKGWRIVRENNIGLVSFLKINMYKDLCNNEDAIKNNAIIRAFAGEKSALQQIPEEQCNYKHDKIPSTENYQVVLADSSQQDAVLLSQSGMSFVMQGPPGTGKSQTITNIISQGLADGKRILFVSEKAAALEVVYKRLAEVHLDDFCLALHSYKANKKEVLENLGKSLELNPIKVKAEEIEKLTELDILKEFLQKYVTDIHKENSSLEMSLYEVFGKLSALDDTIELPLQLENIGEMTKNQVNRLGLLVMDFDRAKNNLGDIWYKNPWNGTIIINVTHELTGQIKERFHKVIYNIHPILQGLQQIKELCSEELYISLNNLEIYLHLVKCLMKCKNTPVIWIGKDEFLQIIKKIAESLEGKNFQIAKNREYLETILDKEFFNINAKEKLAEIRQLIKNIENILKIEGMSWSKYAAEVNREAENIRKLYSLFRKMSYEICRLSETLQISSPVDINDVLAHYRMVHVLNKKHTILKDWFKKDTNDIMNIIENYEKIRVLLESKEKQIAIKSNLNILEADNYTKIINIVKWITKLENYDLIKILTFHELKNYIDNIVKNYNEIAKVYTEVHGEIGEKVSKVLEIPEYISDIDKYIQIIKLLIRNVMPGEKWYDVKEEAQFDLYINSCDEKQKKYKQLKNEIGTKWDKGIFQLDYKSYLSHFRVGYNSIFKIFKKSYREDMKIFKELYHTANGPLKSQDVIIDMLEKVAEIDELERWFIENQELLKKYFGGKFRNIETDFNEIIEDRKEFKECYSLEEIGPRVLFFIDKYNHNEQAYFLLMSELFSKLKHFVESSEMGKLYHQQTISEAVNVHKKYIDNINCTIQLYERVKIYLINAEQITVGGFIDIIKDLSEYKTLQDKEKDFIESLKEVLGKDFVLDIDKLCELKEGINAVEEIKAIWTNVPETIQDIMVSRSDIGQVEYTKDRVLDTVGELCEKLHISNVNELTSEELGKKVESLLCYCEELRSKNESILNYCKTNRKDIDVVDCLEKLFDEQEYYLKISEMDIEYTEKFGHLYYGKSTNWKDIISAIENTSLLNEYINKLNCSKELVKQLIKGNLEKVDLKQVEKNIENLMDCESEYKWICTLFDKTTDFINQELNKTYIRWKNCLEQLPSLDLWIDFRECRKKCCDNGLEAFIIGAEDSYYKTGKLIDSFKKMFYLKWIEEECAKIESIAQFKTRIQNSKIDRFCELDTHQLPVAQMRIREKLIADMPDRNHFNRVTDEMGILLHELNKKRKIMPLRKLFKTIPNLLLKLKPCMMMSPLSVSYFLEAETYKFDMVIFDEASQIFPQDAIGAICRGKQVIIAGDSKQLPPTNFFASSTNNTEAYDLDEEEDDVIYNSILEEAADSLPNRLLLWHYRSRNEQLIAFSNQKIYKNKLTTFPSSNIVEADSGVEYIYVENGIYSGRCNIEEAKKCVEIIKDHIVKHPKRSLGVIAFSEKQQAAIEEEIQRFREKNLIYEPFFSEENEEPFFVKNLENVQGDERDTIIFSICYAKDINGRMYMRFGPLGHLGGENRLNVAITRAKNNIKLVGSIMPYDIDLDKTKSEGVKMLRDYIEFAIKGNVVLKNYKSPNMWYDTDEFCNCICEFLRKKGYTVKQYVGSSDYKIDIAVECPDNPGCFVAGIECDGNSYLMARTIRDREHLRKSILEQMGWKMFRVWSTEWINNRESEQKRLLDFINDAIRTYKKSQQKKNNVLPQKSDNVQVEFMQKKREKSGKLNFPYYEEGDWQMAEYHLEQGNLDNMASKIRVVVQAEQPIHLDLLYRRLAGAFGNEKVTRPVRDTINLVLEQVMSNEIVIEEEFVRFSSYTDIHARIPRGTQERSIEYISKPEIADAMIKVIKNSYGITKNDLCVEVSSIFGYNRMGPKIAKAMNDTIEYMIEKNLISIIDEKMHIKEV